MKPYRIRTKNYGKHLDEEIKARIRSLRKMGCKIQFIADTVGKSKAAVWRVLTPKEKRVDTRSNVIELCDGCGRPLPCVDCARKAAANRGFVKEKNHSLDLELFSFEDEFGEIIDVKQRYLEVKQNHLDVIAELLEKEEMESVT